MSDEQLDRLIAALMDLATNSTIEKHQLKAAKLLVRLFELRGINLSALKRDVAIRPFVISEP